MKYLFILAALVLGASDVKADPNPYYEIQDRTCIKVLYETVEWIKKRENAELYGKVIQRINDENPSVTIFDVTTIDLHKNLKKYSVEIGDYCNSWRVGLSQ